MKPDNAHRRFVHAQEGRLPETEADTDHGPLEESEERYLTRALKEGGEAANCYTGWEEGADTKKRSRDSAFLYLILLGNNGLDGVIRTLAP